MLLSLIVYIAIYELYWKSRSPIHFKVDMFSPCSWTVQARKWNCLTIWQVILTLKLCISRYRNLDIVSSYRYSGYHWHKAPVGNTAPTISAKLSNTKLALYGGDWCNHLVDTLRDYTAKYQKLREAVRNGELGEIGCYWIKYMDCVCLFTYLNKATERSVQVRHKRNAKPVFRADQENYARFLTYYRHFMKHVEKTRPGSEKLLSARV